MSYQGQTINSFIPSYVVKSDYLPTRVVDGNNTQTAQLVNLEIIFSYVNMNKKKEEEEYSHKDQSNLIQTGMHHLKFMRLSELINQSINKVSVVLLEDDLVLIT